MSNLIRSPADAENPEAAHKFLNFIMDAKNMAAASNYVYYANGNLARPRCCHNCPPNEPWSPSTVSMARS